jgi:hypothetical protein
MRSLSYNKTQSKQPIELVRFGDRFRERLVELQRVRTFKDLEETTKIADFMHRVLKWLERDLYLQYTHRDAPLDAMRLSILTSKPKPSSRSGHVKEHHILETLLVTEKELNENTLMWLFRTKFTSSESFPSHVHADHSTRILRLSKSHVFYHDGAF